MIKKYPNEIECLLKNEDSLKLKLKIEKDLFWFKGHFDQYPILAGVAQLDWVIYYFNHFFEVEKKLLGLISVKFQQPIIPLEDVFLSINYLKDRDILLFEFATNNVKSHGKIKLMS